ncbi:hypothetical protein [Treponema sp.]|uniref:hypothetical protein n=1 Tax=Treponema sp. TaxID=166 RepID=UPI00388D9500
MSTSLEKDLHSVYIDGEMPESFVSQYESLVSANPEAKSSLEKMQKLHDLLQEDSSQKTVSSDFIDQSFERLQTKMRYAKNVSFADSSSSKNSKSFIIPFAKYASSFVAAAAVFAVVFIPVHYNSLKSAKETAVAAISIMKEKSIEPIAKKDVIVDGSINKEDLSNGLAISENSLAKTDSNQNEADLSSTVEQKTIYATNLASNTANSSIPFIHERSTRNSINYQFRQNLPSVDAFAPDFSSSSVSITINIPNFHEIGNNIETMKE